MFSKVNNKEIIVDNNLRFKIDKGKTHAIDLKTLPSIQHIRSCLTTGGPIHFTSKSNLTQFNIVNNPSKRATSTRYYVMRVNLLTIA